MTEVVFAHQQLPVEQQKEIRKKLRQLPSWKLEQAYNQLTNGQGSCLEIVESNRVLATSAIAEILWERGKLKCPKIEKQNVIAIP